MSPYAGSIMSKGGLWDRTGCDAALEGLHERGSSDPL